MRRRGTGVAQVISVGVGAAITCGRAVIGRLLTCAAAFWLTAAPAMAKPDEAALRAAKQAELRGGEIYAYDQAAWHATDRFRADLAATPEVARPIVSILRGYIVEPADGRALLVTFFGERDGRKLVVARYTIAGSRVATGGLVGGETAGPLSSMAMRLIDARQRALDYAASRKLAFCSKSPPNTVVLPPRDDGTIPVYLLTSTTTSAIPMGGHFLFEIAADGTLTRELAFSKTCLDMDPARAAKGGIGKPEAAVVTHLLDPQPTEVHSVLSRISPVPLMVVTIGNRAIWQVAHGAVSYVQDVSDRAAPR